MKTGTTGGKSRPFLGMGGDFLVSAGAWHVDAGSGYLTVLKIDAATGESVA